MVYQLLWSGCHSSNFREIYCQMTIGQLNKKNSWKSFRSVICISFLLSVQSVNVGLAYINDHIINALFWWKIWKYQRYFSSKNLVYFDSIGLIMHVQWSISLDFNWNWDTTSFAQKIFSDKPRFEHIIIIWSYALKWLKTITSTKKTLILDYLNMWIQ